MKPFIANILFIIFTLSVTAIVITPIIIVALHSLIFGLILLILEMSLLKTLVEKYGK